MVVFDATVLIDLFHPRTHTDRKSKLDHLVAELQRTKTKIAIPTPALSEFLARAAKARQCCIYSRLSSSTAFKIVAFDTRAAMECALMLDAALTGGDKRANAEDLGQSQIRLADCSHRPGSPMRARSTRTMGISRGLEDGMGWSSPRRMICRCRIRLGRANWTFRITS